MFITPPKVKSNNLEENVLPNCEGSLESNSYEKDSEGSQSALKQMTRLEKIFAEFFGSSSASKGKQTKESPIDSDQNARDSSRSNLYAQSFEKF